MNSTPAGTAASNGLQIQIHSPSSGATANTGDHRQGSRMILEGYLRMRGRHAHENPLEAAKEAIQNENPRQWMKTWTVLTKEAFTWGSADAAGEQEEEDEARDEEAIGYLSSGLSNRGSISCSIVRRVLEEKDHRMFILVCNVGSLIVQCPGDRSFQLWDRAFTMCFAGGDDTSIPEQQNHPPVSGHTRSEQTARHTVSQSGRSTASAHSNLSSSRQNFTNQRSPASSTRKKPTGANKTGKFDKEAEYKNWQPFALNSLDEYKHVDGIDPSTVETVAAKWAEETSKRRAQLWGKWDKKMNV